MYIREPVSVFLGYEIEAESVERTSVVNHVVTRDAADSV